MKIQKIKIFYFNKAVDKATDKRFQKTQLREYEYGKANMGGEYNDPERKLLYYKHTARHHRQHTICNECEEVYNHADHRFSYHGTDSIHRAKFHRGYQLGAADGICRIPWYTVIDREHPDMAVYQRTQKEEGSRR